MFKLDTPENIEKARAEIFSKIDPSKVFINIYRKANTFRIYLKIPLWLEREILKINELHETNKLFGMHDNKAQFYRGVILDQSIDDINEKLFLTYNKENAPKPILNLAVTRLKDANKGLVLVPCGKIPLLAEDIVKKSIDNFAKELEALILTLKTKVNVTKEVAVKK